MNNKLPNKLETRIAVFKGKEIRKTIYNNEWWFVIEAVISVLTDSVQTKGYIKDMRRRDPELAKGWGQIATPPFSTNNWRTAEAQLCQYRGNFPHYSVHTFPKAEPFKRWLAKVGYEHVQEIEDPELGTKRTKALYRAKNSKKNQEEKSWRRKIIWINRRPLKGLA
jgi:DNA-damage-inducible protein D